MDVSQLKWKPALPFKSVAAALIFSFILGPVGLLYSSIRGGITMIIVGFIVVSTKFIVPIILVWLMSCIWSAISVEKYNKKVFELLRQSSF